MSKKYVIDLPDDAQYILINGASENHCYTRVEQVDDLEELNSDYINEHYGELQDEAYHAGLNDAWEAARRITVNMDVHERARVFFQDAEAVTHEEPFKSYSAQEAIAKLRVYKEKQKDRIEVGDEVIAPCGKAVVTLIETDDLVHYLYSGGGHGCIEPQRLKKTGKHYDIQSILEAMRK